MEHLAETMTDFLLRHKYITEEQAEWCHYIYIECGDCQRAVSRSCKNLLCVFDTTGAPVIVPVHDVEYLFSTTVDKSECRARSEVPSSRKPTSVNYTKAGSTSISATPTPAR